MCNSDCYNSEKNLKLIWKNKWPWKEDPSEDEEDWVPARADFIFSLISHSFCAQRFCQSIFYKIQMKNYKKISIMINKHCCRYQLSTICNQRQFTISNINFIIKPALLSTAHENFVLTFLRATSSSESVVKNSSCERAGI